MQDATTHRDAFARAGQLRGAFAAERVLWKPCDCPDHSPVCLAPCAGRLWIEAEQAVFNAGPGQAVSMKLVPGPRRTLAFERHGQAAAAGRSRRRDGRRHVPAERGVAGQRQGAPRQARRVPAAMARREHQRGVLQREGAPAQRRAVGRRHLTLTATVHLARRPPGRALKPGILLLVRMRVSSQSLSVL
jgi:hypothetical protein